MRTSSTGIALIKEFEGFPNHGCPYRDPIGVWTRGYGRTEGITSHSPCITIQEASAELSSLLHTDYEPPVNQFDLTQNQYDATVSFVYNLGVGMLQSSHTFGALLRQGKFREAADSMLLYDKAGGTTLPGLTRRRKAERALFLTQSGPLPASRFNAPGEKHNDQWRKPKNNSTPLYYPNGTLTGQSLEKANLLWPDHEGTLQLDFKERVSANGRNYVFHRGGYIPSHPPQPYGHVWVGDIAERLGDPVPPGDGRGDPAPRTKLVTLQVTEIPETMGYKTAGGSRWNNYGDPAAKYGDPGAYSYMTWSTVRTEAGYDGPIGDTIAGGGIVRALVPNGGHLWLCNVERIHMASVDSNGNRNGTVVAAYCERSGLSGWVVVASQYKDRPLVHHIV